MTNGHHVTPSFEGEELPYTGAELAIEKLVSLADEIQNGGLDAPNYEAAVAALASLREQIDRGPRSFRQIITTAAMDLDPPLLETMERAVEGAKPIRVSTWGIMRPQPRRWLVQDWLPAGRVAMLTGEGGAGKSRLALQLAAGVASGGGSDGAWLEAPQGVLSLGDSIHQGGAPVVFASWEDEPDEFWRRLHQISGQAAPWVSPERLHNLFIANMMGEGPVWAPSHGLCQGGAGRADHRRCAEFRADRA